MTSTTRQQLGGPRVGRRRMQRSGTVTTLLQGRVAPEVRERANAMADACGSSLSILLEALVEQTPIDPATGRPVWWDAVMEQPKEEPQPRLVS